MLAGNDDPNLPLVTCSQDGKEVYLLDKSIISGEQIENATSGLDQQRGEYVVDVEFKSDASKIWADFTAANVGTQTAFVLDSKVVSAPEIQEAIPGGRTQITGQFTADSARELANVLKYGSLPLSFESSEAETVSATLGLTSLRAGLIAGAIGLALVLLYSLLYYRVLGLLAALSLVASGAMVFAILVLLGRYINYTLDLAGIAGLIIGIGTTADSFVVFFERIKDEIREGRSFRSAVPRGWARARKTILSGNAVTLPGRRGAVLPGGRPGEGLRVHAGPDHDPRRRRGVPGDLAAGVPGVEVADAGQAGAQRARRGAADRARTTSGRTRDGTGIARWPPNIHPTRPSPTGVEAPDLESAASDAPRHGFFVRLYTGTGAFEVIGRRKLWFTISGADRRDRDRQHRDPRLHLRHRLRGRHQGVNARRRRDGHGHRPAGRGRVQQGARQVSPNRW